MIVGPAPADRRPVGGTVIGTGLNGADRDLTGVAALPRAPGVDGPAAVVDLDLLQHWGTRVGRSARIAGLVRHRGPGRAGRVRTALQRAGIEISGVRRVSDVRASYDTSVPAWSLQLGVLAAVAGLLLAALVLVLLVASTWRRRSRDLACLGLSGVPAPRTRPGRGRRAAARSSCSPSSSAPAAGCSGPCCALPTVPLFARPRRRLDPRPVDAVGDVLAVLAAALVVLGLVAWLCGRARGRGRARLSRVREAL